LTAGYPESLLLTPISLTEDVADDHPPRPAGSFVNLLKIPGSYDIALRDLGLVVAAVALGRLAAAHAPVGRIGADW
jgi:hypothetical protein